MQQHRRYDWPKDGGGGVVVVRRQLGSVNSSLTWRINDCASWLLDPPHDYTPTPTRSPVHLPDPHLPRHPAVHGPPVMGGEARQDWQGRVGLASAPGTHLHEPAFTFVNLQRLGLQTARLHVPS